LRFETSFNEPPIGNAGRQTQNIATHRISNLHLGGGVGQITGISRIPEMIQDLFVEHRSHYKREAKKAQFQRIF
jgi:hypothetical protein